MFGTSERSELYRLNTADDDRLLRIERSWHHRAQIKAESRRLVDIRLDSHLPDFVDVLLPFHTDTRFCSYPEALKQRIRSAGWVLYNQKTIVIETEIICPACIDLLRAGTALSYTGAATVSQTLADEAFHSLFSINLCELTIAQRGLPSNWATLLLTRHLCRAQKSMSEDSFKLYRLGFAVVSESFISDYLTALSQSTDIQPVFRRAVELHKKDEAVHKNIFPLFTRDIHARLEMTGRTAFIEGIIDAVELFPRRDRDAWRSVLVQLVQESDFDGLDLPIEFDELGAVDYSAIPSVMDAIGVPRHSYEPLLAVHLERRATV